MGVDSSKLGFKSVIENSTENYTYGKVLRELASSKTFPASITPVAVKNKNEMTSPVDSAQVTKETILKKMRMSTFIPMLIAATCYLVITLLF